MAIGIAVVLVGCGTEGEAHRSGPGPAEPATARVAASRAPAKVAGEKHAAQKPAPRPEALVTEESEDRLVSVDLASGKVERRIAPPADPEFVAADRGTALVVSPDAGAVTLVHSLSLQPIRTLRSFGAPHIAELSPDGRYAYVTDDARGELSVIRLRDGRLLGRTSVGAEAHHMAVRPDGGRVWLALGESARTIVIVDTSNPAKPRMLDQFDPGFAVHDLAFAPDGKRVWLTASDSEDIGVFSAQDHRLLLRVPGGTPPQHVVFDGPRAYVTSGYGSRIELVTTKSGRVLKTAAAPYGSFNLDVGDGYVAVASLLRGTLAVYDDRLRQLRVLQLAPAARDVAISSG